MTPRKIVSYSAACPTCGAEADAPCLVWAWPKPRRAHYTHAHRRLAVAALVAGSVSRHPAGKAGCTVSEHLDAVYSACRCSGCGPAGKSRA